MLIGVSQLATGDFSEVGVKRENVRLAISKGLMQAGPFPGVVGQFPIITAYQALASMEEYVGLSLGLQANGGSSANRGNALGKFTLTDYCVGLLPLLKCRKKRECFAVG